MRNCTGWSRGGAIGADAPPVTPHFIDANLAVPGAILRPLPTDQSAMHLRDAGLTNVIAASQYGARMLRERWRLLHDVSVQAAHHMPNKVLMAHYWPRFIGLLDATEAGQAKTAASIAAAKAGLNGFRRSFELANQGACHHRTLKMLPLELLSAAELFGGVFALNFDQHDTQAEKRELLRAQIVNDQIMINLAQGATIYNRFAEMIGLADTITAHDGAIGWVDGRLQSAGVVPSGAQFSAISEFLEAETRGEIHRTDELVAACPAAADFAAVAAGILVAQFPGVEIV